MKPGKLYLLFLVLPIVLPLSGCDQLLEALKKTSEDRDWELQGTTTITDYPNAQKLQGYTLVRDSGNPEVEDAIWHLKNTDTDKGGTVGLESQTKLRFAIPLEGLANGSYTLKVDIYYTTGEEDHLEYRITINISN